MFISSNPPLIPGIWTVVPTSTMVRLRLQRAATKSSCLTKRGTKEVQPGTKQGQPGTKQGQLGTKTGTTRDKTGTARDKKGTRAYLDKRLKFYLEHMKFSRGFVCLCIQDFSTTITFEFRALTILKNKWQLF